MTYFLLQSHLRDVSKVLDDAANDPRARYLVFDKLRIPLIQDGELSWFNSETIKSLVPEDWQQPRVFLGIDEDNGSIPYWALDVTGLESVTKGMVIWNTCKVHSALTNCDEFSELETRSHLWAEARPAAFKLTSRDAAIVAQARALVDWNARRPFCPSCGSKTVSKEAGYKRYCTKDDCKAHKGVQNYGILHDCTFCNIDMLSIPLQHTHELIL